MEIDAVFLVRQNDSALLTMKRGKKLSAISFQLSAQR